MGNLKAIKEIPLEQMIIQRKTKFKAWDKAKRKFVENRSWYSISSDGEPCWNESCDFPSHADELVLIQFIGQKDTSGEDIYEGHFVEDSLGNKWAVQYNPNLGAYLLYSKNGAKYIDSPLKIIGNVFENPDLDIQQLVCERSY